MEDNQSITRFVKGVLAKRFPGDKARQKINPSANKLNFACPYCGDSKTDRFKKRGNLHLDTHTFKCYNDGCAIWVPIHKFIATFAGKYKQAIPTLKESTLKFDTKKSATGRGFIIEFLLNHDANMKLLSFAEVAKRFSLTPCIEADPKSFVGTYVRNRCMVEMPLFEKTCYYNSSQNKIFLFNIDIKSDRLLGFAIRKIDDNAPGLRYDIKDYKSFKDAGLIKGLEEDYLNEVIQINNYYNVLNLNFTDVITVTEGQIDAMFIKNCVATTGVSKSNGLIGSLTTKKSTRILFDNDRAGREASIEYLKLGYRVFLWSNVIRDLKKKYPKAIVEIMKKVKDINNLYTFIKRRDTTLNYDTFNDLIDQYFSDSIFDLIAL